MTTRHFHDALLEPGLYEFLQAIEQVGDTALPEEDILSMMTVAGIGEPRAVFTDLRAAGILQHVGTRIGISSLGIRSIILLDALNGSDLQTTFRRLSALDNSLHSYQLVREGMTDDFLLDLNSRPGFRRLYLCSPWVGLSDRNVEALRHAISAAESGGHSPELLVITRPDKNGDPPRGATPFRDLGATMYLNSNLHTKLYVREPGPNGGQLMAIVGSENLTRSNHLELGIKVNADMSLTYQLIEYFWSLTARSKEVTNSHD